MQMFSRPRATQVQEPRARRRVQGAAPAGPAASFSPRSHLQPNLAGFPAKPRPRACAAHEPTRAPSESEGAASRGSASRRPAPGGRAGDAGDGRYHRAAAGTRLAAPARASSRRPRPPASGTPRGLRRPGRPAAGSLAAPLRAACVPAPRARPALPGGAGPGGRGRAAAAAAETRARR